MCGFAECCTRNELQKIPLASRSRTARPLVSLFTPPSFSKPLETNAPFESKKERKGSEEGKGVKVDGRKRAEPGGDLSCVRENIGAFRLARS